MAENTGDNAVPVSVETRLDQYTAPLDTSVSGGETIVRRELVTAEQGDVVTLIARLGSTGDDIRFQFLLAGGSEDPPPEVAGSHSGTLSRRVRLGLQQPGKTLVSLVDSPRYDVLGLV